MPERFGNGPRWVRRVLWVLAVVTYALIAALSLIVITWPAAELTHVELALGRVGGLIAFVAALAALASYPWHRWRVEMHATWALGIALTFVAAAAASVDYSSSRGMLVVALIIVVLCVYVRAVQLVLFGLQTTAVANRARRWRRAHSGG